MGQFGSTVNLVASHHDEGGHTTTPVRYTEEEPKVVRQQRQNLPSKLCLIWFSLFVVFMLIGLMTGIGVVYITQLQKHIQHLEDREQVLEELGKALGKEGKDLEERVKALETRSPCENCKPRNLNEHSNAMKGLGLKNYLKIRLKRHLNHTVQAEELPHVKAEHHSIGSHNIALLYADRDKLPVDGNGGDAPTFRESTRVKSACTGAGKQLMVNTRNDNYWCRKWANSSELVDTMQFTGGNHKFYYFSKERWMNSKRAKENYKFTDEGRIQVLKEGIYIVHASVHFSSVSSEDDPHYGVYTKKGGSNKPRRLISKCMMSVSERNIEDGPGIYPCQVWQLQHLMPDDEVFLDIGGYTWFRIERETFHLALIKLTGDPLVV